MEKEEFWKIYTNRSGTHNKFWSVLNLKGKETGIIAYGRIGNRATYHKYTKNKMILKLHDKIENKGYVLENTYADNPDPSQ